MRFSIKALLMIIAAVAIVCAILFAVPPYVRNATLFIGVIALPAPLITTYLSANKRRKMFALGALVSYGIWFVVVGVPGGFLAMRTFGDFMGASLTAFDPSFVSVYLTYLWLYAPWLIVAVGGTSSWLICLANDSSRKTNINPDE